MSPSSCHTLLLVAFSSAPGFAQDAGIRFEDVTAQVAIQYAGPSYGAAWGDFDADGRPDIWVSGHSPIHLYRNTGNRFVDLAGKAVTVDPTDRHGAAWADFDNDGDQDLLQLVGAELGTGRGDNHLLVQHGGKLADEATARGIGDSLGRGRTPLWVDFDGDGRLDVVVNNEAREDVPTSLFRQIDGGRFEDVTVRAGLEVGTSHFGVLAHLDATEQLQVLFGPPFPSKVYAISDGLRDVTATYGIPARPTNDAVIVDLDNDLRPDLVSVVGSLPADVAQPAADHVIGRLQAATGACEMRFETSGAVLFMVYPFSKAWWPPETVFIGAAGTHPQRIPFRLTAEAATGLSPLADTERGVFVGFDAESGTWRVRLSTGGTAATVNILAHSTAPVTGLERVGFGEFAPSSAPRLLYNEADGFVDRSERLGLPGRINSQAIGAGDFDNDMDVDLYLVCTGALRNSPNVLLENRGDGTFRPVEGAGGATGGTRGLGEIVAIADHDRDGFLDLFVTNGLGLAFGDGPYLLYRNRGNANHWLQIDLEGTASNRDGIGARVVVTAGGVAQVRTRDNGVHGKVQDSSRLHFGLAGHAIVDEIVVQWPSGREQTLTDVAADQVLRIVER